MPNEISTCIWAEVMLLGMTRRVLITGANSGLGKEAARQLALAGVDRVYLGCRSRDKAEAARAELERDTNKDGFEIVMVDVGDVGSVRGAVAALDEPLDALIMNAGGLGGASPGAHTPQGATNIFAGNVLGHCVLLDALVEADKLTGVALFAGAEAARGIPMLRMERPELESTSVDAFVSIIDGRFFGDRVDPMKAFPYVKLMAALWMASAARQYPQLRLVTISPGGSAGSSMSDVPAVLRFVLRGVVQPVLKMLGKFHDLQTGAGRYLSALYDAEAFRSGVFYGAPYPGLTGEPVDQSAIFPLIGDEAAQDNANEAIHRFVG